MPAATRAHRAAGDVGHAAVLDIGMGDAGADAQMPSGRFLDLLEARAMPVMSTSRSGCTSRRLSIGPSDWPPAMNFDAACFAAPSSERGVDIARALIVEADRLHRRAPALARCAASPRGRGAA